MEITKTKKPSYFAGAEMLINHLLFGSISQPNFDNDDKAPINPHLIALLAISTNPEQQKLDYKLYNKTFKEFVDDFLIDCVRQPKPAENIDINSKAYQFIEDFAKESFYHSDEIRYTKISNGEFLQVLHIDRKENSIKIMKFHTIHLFDLAKVIEPGQTNLSESQYSQIVNAFEKLSTLQEISFSEDF